MIVKRIKFYSEPEGNRGGARTRLEDVKSHRGLGRNFLVGGGVEGALGGYVGKKAANKADAEGKSDEEIKKIATKKATKAGALIGGTGALASAIVDDRMLKKLDYTKLGRVGIAAGTLAAGTGLSALGARLGAKKNTEVRLKKRKKIDQKPNPGIYIVR